MHIKTVQNYKIIPSVILFFIYFSLKTSKINTNTVYMQQNMQTAYKKKQYFGRLGCQNTLCGRFRVGASGKNEGRTISKKLEEYSSKTTGLKALSLPRLRRGPLPFTTTRASMVLELYPSSFCSLRISICSVDAWAARIHCRTDSVS